MLTDFLKNAYWAYLKKSYNNTVWKKRCKLGERQKKQNFEFYYFKNFIFLRPFLELSVKNFKANFKFYLTQKNN